MCEDLEKFQKKYSESGKYTTWRTDDFQSVNFSLSELFGKPVYDGKKDSGITTFHLTGKKVALLSNYQYFGVENGDRQYLVVFDLNFHNSTRKSGF